MSFSINVHQKHIRNRVVFLLFFYFAMCTYSDIFDGNLLNTPLKYSAPKDVSTELNIYSNNLKHI
jgi:hypothetical protein